MKEHWLFVLKGDPDLDNIVPLIWKTLEEGQPAILFFESRYRIKDDFRLKFLSAYKNIKILNAGLTSIDNLVLNRLFRPLLNYFLLLFIVKLLRVKVCIFEWSEGVAGLEGAECWLKKNFFLTLSRQLKRVCFLNEITAIALPHGTSTKSEIVFSKHVLEVMKLNNGLLPFYDRASYSKYIFASDYHRESIVKNSDLPRSCTEVWGSLRFSVEWMTKLYEICPQACLPQMLEAQKHRVLFFLPKWHNNVDRAKTISLILRLSDLPSIQLVLKSHPRKEHSSFSFTEREMILERRNVVYIVENISSPSLIRDSDVIIDLDSSIAFDAILQKKLYVRPRYLNDGVHLVYDKWGGALQTLSEEETVNVLLELDKSLLSVSVSEDFLKNTINPLSVNIVNYYFNEIKGISNENIDRI